jgi:hypothetical protein
MSTGHKEEERWSSEVPNHSTTSGEEEWSETV